MLFRSRLFEGVPSPTEMVRYHSLACSDLPSTVRATAVAADGVLMALEHTTLPQWGVQFHPESIASEHGRTIVANFLRIAGIGPARTRPAPAPPLPADAPLLHEVIETRLDGERLFAEAFRDSPAAVWLDGIAEGSRFSVLGDDSGPLAHRLTYDAAARRITITDRAGTQVREGRLFDHLRALPRAPGVPDLPFALGYCGYFGYELRQDCGSPVRHRSPFADAQLLYLDRAVVLDHQEGRAHLLALPHPENERWLREMRLTNLPEVEAATPSAGRVTWRDSRETYRAKVMAAQEHLAAGESYELCLTNHASVRCPEDPFTVYQQLRRVNPAPYAAFLRLPGIAILSSSPELFLKVDRDGGVTARPIKGTRRRTAGDVGVVEDLRSSEKDRSENLMITDLLRNDLGRVCAIGSVRVPSLFAVEIGRAHV